MTRIKRLMDAWASAFGYVPKASLKAIDSRQLAELRTEMIWLDKDAWYIIFEPDKWHKNWCFTRTETLHPLTAALKAGAHE